MNVIEHFKNARHIVNLQAGQKLFKQGSPGEVMYVLLDGTAQVVVENTVVELALPGAILGEMVLIDKSERSATVLASTNCKLVAIDSRQFDRLIQESPDFARYVMVAMAQRLRRMNERLSSGNEQAPAPSIATKAPVHG